MADEMKRDESRSEIEGITECGQTRGTSREMMN
jgi:hypothetical protein